ncbi:MAG: SDR family oxidoreductase [Trueperaceae bacterium]
MANVVVTGIAGCIGSWIARHLLEEGHRVIGIDVAQDLPNARLLGIQGDFELHRIDVTDSEAFSATLRDAQPDGIIHLASLLMPKCKENPMLCVDVNVKSFMTVLESARELGSNVAYASSAWVLNAPEGDRMVTEADPTDPQSLYGVFKMVNEGMSQTYARDFGVKSNGLRPYIVYGPGREVGLTADINLALLAASRGQPYRIGFGGTVALHHASDVAKLFIKLALSPVAGGKVYNVRGTVEPMAEVVNTIERVTGTSGLLEAADNSLPIAANLSDAALQKDYGPFDYLSLEEGFGQTLGVYRQAGVLE